MIKKIKDIYDKYKTYIYVVLLICIILLFTDATNNTYDTMVKKTIGKRIVIDGDTLTIINTNDSNLFLSNRMMIPYEQFKHRIIK